MQYKYFKDGIKLSRLGMGVMRLPVLDSDDSKIDFEKAQKLIDQCMGNWVASGVLRICFKCRKNSSHLPVLDAKHA